MIILWWTQMRMEIIAEKETYDEDELNNRVIQLEDKECNVLGVIIRE